MFASRLAVLGMIKDWADRSGIEVPETVLAAATEEERNAFDGFLNGFGVSKTIAQRLFNIAYCAQRIVDKQPNFFGFASWSIDIVLIRELQLRGKIAHMAEHQHLMEAHA